MNRMDCQSSQQSVEPPPERLLEECPVTEAERVVIEAEQFRATVEPPAGNSFDLSPCILNPEVGAGVGVGIDKGEDDEYFHLACHVDSTLKAKIERGEYVDLDRLLP